ncbi:hydantoinase/oxoprolinase family protein [Halalkalicoccus jeotgali]|uniref:N-methylhydantoinase A 1 n=1 Tax=Halalkalicoccus jeotgali (strain DSM 18796 / CECT 7217 / JCM 14584 / KCTC 4019 / B3) TaxID=795797 RepID=L9VLA7_HALJB|nr:hydantoinase/oxoprolinase family protein [Halalkalicoccus jeotgali]ELY37939.1 N-methylhydantoinase A 1 [Halalkalicoccus jeotgali B3]
MHDTHIGVDVGGTFTDVALYTDEDLTTAKVPSTEDQSVGVMAGIEKACEEAGIDPDEIAAFSHAMTVSVNALLERDGAKTALVTTEGFRDVLEIGRQARPDLYDLDAEKPAALVPRKRRYELDERATPEGIERAIDEGEVRELARELDGVESVAVCLLHAYAHDDNERRVAELLREALDVPVSTSSEVLAEFREFERSSTTAVDAYVTPAINSYVGRLAERAAEAGVPVPRIMQSNGGTAEADTVREHAVTTVLSGPAAGVVGAGATVPEEGGLVTFDMGGTSSDVSLVRDGEIERTTDAEIDGIPIGTPMVDVNTVGAGGGSIAWVDPGGALRVGPRSAGAEPGPACYGKGGERATVTDANVVLGYIGPETALGGEMTLDVEAAHDVLEDLAEEAGLENALEAARGVYRVANANMARAVRAVTVERGYDPRGFGLVAFGGAGPMHAVSLAESLDIERVVVPRPAGVLSAFGLLAADEKHDAVRTYRAPLEEADSGAVESVYADLEERVREETATGEPAIERAADLRYVGQSFEITVPLSEFDPAALEERFHAAHNQAYGYRMDEAVELVNLRATATVPREAPPVSYEGGGDPVVGTREAYFPGGGRHEATIYDRDRLAPGERVAGPAVLEQAESTTVLPPEWVGTVETDGTLTARRED